MPSKLVARSQSGHVVGDVRGGWLRKSVVTRRHLLRLHDAWATDVRTIAEARRLGAHGIELRDERGNTWRASFATLEAHGILIDFGHGQQLALPRRYWAFSPSAQLSLFDDTEVAR